MGAKKLGGGGAKASVHMLKKTLIERFQCELSVNLVRISWKSFAKKSFIHLTSYLNTHFYTHSYTVR